MAWDGDDDEQTIHELMYSPCFTFSTRAGDIGMPSTPSDFPGDISSDCFNHRYEGRQFIGSVPDQGLLTLQPRIGVA
jgi:hypothetical protein